MKILMVKNYVKYIFFYLLVLACNHKQDKQSDSFEKKVLFTKNEKDSLKFMPIDSSLKCKRIFIPIDTINTDSAIGIKYFSEIDNWAPRSICVSDSLVFIPDEFNRRLIKINLENSEITFGKPVKSEFTAFDIITLDDIVLVAHVGWILKFSKDLDFIEGKRLSNTSGTFVKHSNDYVEVYYQYKRELYKIYKDTIILKSQGKYYDIFKSIHGKKINIINENLLQLDDSIIYLKDCKYSKLDYEGFNIDFNQYWLVFFNIKEDNLVLNIINRQS